METILNMLSQPPSKDIVLWVVLIENIGVLVWLLRHKIHWRLSSLPKKQ